MSNDEIADLGNGINLFMDKLQQILKMIIENTNHMENVVREVGESVATSNDSATDLSAMTEELSATMQDVGHSVSVINNNTENVRGDVEMIAHKSGEINEFSKEMKANADKMESDARNNMGNSLMIACAKMGMHFTACTAKEYFPNQALVEQCEQYASESGGSITLTEDTMTGTKDADVIYTDVWVSMGEPDEVWKERTLALSPYQVNAKVMQNAGEQALFMHCLPAFHDLKTKIGKEVYEKFGYSELEVTDEVFESKQSVVFDEAENRMHTIKAVMFATLGGEQCEK